MAPLHRRRQHNKHRESRKPQTRGFSTRRSLCLKEYFCLKGRTQSSKPFLQNILLASVLNQLATMLIGNVLTSSLSSCRSRDYVAVLTSACLCFFADVLWYNYTWSVFVVILKEICHVTHPTLKIMCHCEAVFPHHHHLSAWSVGTVGYIRAWSGVIYRI